LIDRATQSSLWRGLKQSRRTLLIVLAMLLTVAAAFRWYRGIGSLEDARPRILLTLAGVAVGLWLATILIAGMRRWQKLCLLGLAALAISQACYLTLVWTQLKPHVWLWRAWWLSVVPSLTIPHIVWLNLTAPPAHKRLARFTEGIAVAAACLFAYLGLRENLLEDPSPAYLAMLAALASGSVVGSALVWVRRRRLTTHGGLPMWQKVGWVLVAQAAVFIVGFYAGRITAPEPGVLDVPPSPLAHLAPEELDAQVRADLGRLRMIADGIDALAKDASAVSGQIRRAMETDGRAYYLPAEEDQLKSRFMTYLAYRSALLRLVAGYGGFASVPWPEARARCFLVGYGAGATVMRASTLLISAYGDDPAVRRKLNEADASCAIPAGEFDRIHHALLNDRNARTFDELAAYYQANRDAWRQQQVLSSDDMTWLDGQIERAIADVHARDIDRTRTRIARLVERVRQDAYVPYYDAQSVISTLIGDTRIVSRPPFISHDRIKSIQPQLLPGDILLERRNWYASNAFLPGFWPHAAIYIGTIQDLERLGLVRRDGQGRWTSDQPAVRDRLDQYLALAHDREPHTVLESVSEGVIFNSLTESMGADYVAALRPRLSDQEKASAIARAFAHEGKPYDFEFDFFSADKLVCTELVYRSYEGMLHFELVRIMGRDTLPALEIARSFAATRDRPDRQFDFVLFLDAVPDKGTVQPADAEAFCASVHRPRAFNE
jgi:hypothetical protein